MISYYFKIALRSFRRNKMLTALMVCAIALGIGSSMTTQTVLYVLSGDPLPEKSNRVFMVQLAPMPLTSLTPGEEPPEQVTRFDAEALLRAKRAKRQAMMTGGDVALEPSREDLSPFYAGARYTSADFFPMFNVPLAHGSFWTEVEDEARARVVVISAELDEKLFEPATAVGQTLRLNGIDFQVVGVLKPWRASPTFFDLNRGRYRKSEEVYIPFSAAIEGKFSHSGSRSCWAESRGDLHGLSEPCVWMQFWVELESAADAAEYRDFLAAYSDDQRTAGRFEQPNNIRLRNVMNWLEYKEVVPGDVRLQAWLALGFLLVCLLNTVGLLLAKFMRRSSEIGVRRALGAPRSSIFAQLLVEAGAIGLIGAVFGLGLVWAGLWAVRNQPTPYADLIHLDTSMLVATVGLAVLASILAALLPAWRACTISPALQVKAQ